MSRLPKPPKTKSAITAGMRIAARYVMSGLGIVDQSHWREWLMQQYNYEMIHYLARRIDGAIAAATRKAQMS